MKRYSKEMVVAKYNLIMVKSPEVPASVLCGYHALGDFFIERQGYVERSYRL